MTIAFYIKIPGLSLQLKGQRNIDNEPINLQADGIGFNIEQFSLNAKMYS